MRACMFGEPSWLEMAARAFDFIGSAMSRGDRLGHSWRAGPAQVSRPRVRFRRHDPRRAGALRGDRASAPISTRRWPGSSALDRDYANAETGTYYLTAADAEGLVIRPAATADEATPNHNAVAAQNLIRLAVLAGDDAWREKADRLIAAIAPQAAENLYMHMALLNAIDLRLRAAEIVVTGEGPRAEALLAAARAAAAARPHRAACRLGRRAAARTPGARQDRRGERAAGLRLRRRNLLAAGDRSGRPQCRHRSRATFLTMRSIRARFVLYGSRGAQQGRPNHATRIDPGGCPDAILGHAVGDRRARRRMVRLCHPRRMRSIECGYSSADGLRDRHRQGRHVLRRSRPCARYQAHRAGQLSAQSCHRAAEPRRRAPQLYVFIESKNSPLFLVLRSLSSRKSMASMVPIGLRMRRSTYIFLS